jgi:hypothetical protein
LKGGIHQFTGIVFCILPLIGGIIKTQNNMKHMKLLLGLVAVLILFSRCEEQMETGLTDEAAERRTLDKIKKNQGISLGLFDVLGNRIGTDSLKRLIAVSKTTAEFIDLMSDQTENYFTDVVELNKTDFLIPAIPTPFMGEAEITLKAILSEEENAGAMPFDPVQAYSDLVLKRINEQAASDPHKEWILLESLHESGSTPRHMPAESMSLNFEKIKMLATIPHTVILNPELSDEEVLETLLEIMTSHDIPPVAIALLVPAVQKWKEESTSATSEPFDKGLLAWIDDTVAPATSGGLDRDIIRRIQATAYLAGLHTLTLPNYENKNQDLASLSILHARYRGGVICASGDVKGKG